MRFFSRGSHNRKKIKGDNQLPSEVTITASCVEPTLDRDSDLLMKQNEIYSNSFVAGCDDDQNAIQVTKRTSKKHRNSKKKLNGQGEKYTNFFKRKSEKSNSMKSIKGKHKRAESLQPDFAKQLENRLKESAECQNSQNSSSNPVGRITMVSRSGLKYKMDLYSKEHMDLMIKQQKLKFQTYQGDNKLVRVQSIAKQDNSLQQAVEQANLQDQGRSVESPCPGFSLGKSLYYKKVREKNSKDLIRNTCMPGQPESSMAKTFAELENIYDQEIKLTKHQHSNSDQFIELKVRQMKSAQGSNSNSQVIDFNPSNTMGSKDSKEKTEMLTDLFKSNVSSMQIPNEHDESSPNLEHLNMKFDGQSDQKDDYSYSQTMQSMDTVIHRHGSHRHGSDQVSGDQSFADSRQTDNPFGICIKQFDNFNQPMGSLQDPHMREKYTRFELVALIKQYKIIQKEINNIQSSLRDKYYLCDVPNIRDPQYKNKLRALRQLESQRSNIFNEAKLRQTMICGVQIQSEADQYNQQPQEDNDSEGHIQVKVQEVNDLASIEELPQEDVQSLVIAAKNKESHVTDEQIYSSSTTNANESSSKPNEGQIQIQLVESELQDRDTNTARSPGFVSMSAQGASGLVSAEREGPQLEDKEPEQQEHHEPEQEQNYDENDRPVDFYQSELTRVVEQSSEVDQVDESTIEKVPPRMNLRRELWQIVCNIDDLKHQMLQEFNDNEKMKPFAERTYLKDGLELYKYYLNRKEPFSDSRILGKDLTRTRPKCVQYRVDPTTGENALYNVLYAYSQFDLEIGYCQGMNYFVDMFWQNLQSEEDCFYCLVHLMKVQEWRYCFNMEMTKLKELLEFLEQVMQTTWSNVLKHIIYEIFEGEEDQVSLVPIFSPLLQTIFVYQTPENIALHIFDVFLFDGDQVIFTLLINMIKMQEQKILSLESKELLDYMKKEMTKECFDSKSMMILLD